MSAERASLARAPVPTWLVITAGLVGLAVALGIGRFAFTPLLPLMMRDGMLEATGGAEWAAANYAGYLVGALIASRFAGAPALGLRLGLLGVALTTLAMTWVGSALTGATLRAAAGVFSAWALVCGSSWCLAELARRGVVWLGAWIYTGIGIGIAGAGALAWLGGHQPAQALWLEFGLVAVAGAAFVWVSLRGAGSPSGTDATPVGGPARRPLQRRDLALLLCYASVGFGYIVPATFLPAMASQQVSDPRVFGLAWPLFGLAATVSVAVAARWMPDWPRRRLWALAQTLMACGTAVPLLSQSVPALALAAVLVGGTFMVATMAGLQSGREQCPENATPLLARMTVAFALGQIAGPLLVRALGSSLTTSLEALLWSHAAATVLLAIAAAWLWAAPRAGREPKA